MAGLARHREGTLIPGSAFPAGNPIRATKMADIKTECDKQHAGSGIDKPVRPGLVESVVTAVKDTFQKSPPPSAPDPKP